MSEQKNLLIDLLNPFPENTVLIIKGQKIFGSCKNQFMNMIYSKIRRNNELI
jgi:hypothetical protein